VTFVPGRGSARELETLATAERRYCAFARREVAQDPDHAARRITGTAERLAAIAMTFDAEGTQGARVAGAMPSRPAKQVLVTGPAGVTGALGLNGCHLLVRRGRFG
jgi:hypothetical protein